ncbi:MAG TPA: amidohydrolase [Longimicrobiales bacterium]|nr:amidohydrolase [Longimicrobiales bacterium]
MRKFIFVVATLCASAAPTYAQTPNPPSGNANLLPEVERRAKAVEAKVVTWRRDLHQHPELGNQEVRTAKIVADHLRSLGMEVRTNVAVTGVIGVLKGGRPGPVVALRADMDALPVTEMVDLPFASKVRSTFNGQDVGVMHACGHDAHVAMLMGVAEILAGMKAQLPGTIKFIFQPAEEGLPPGQVGGAEQMLKEGAFNDPKPQAVFGLHVISPIPAGHIVYKAGGQLAAVDRLDIVVRGKQTHGAMPWGGVDPIVAASQIVLGLQTIASRQVDVLKAPIIVTIGQINGGVRNNIIPDSVVLVGTLRTLDPGMREDVRARVKRTAEQIAAAAGATAQVTIHPGYPVTVNDERLTQWAAPILERVTGAGKAYTGPPSLGGEDFSYFANQAPGFFFFLGTVPPNQDPATAAANHSPYFFVDESTLPVGTRALANLAVEYLARPAM